MFSIVTAVALACLPIRVVDGDTVDFCRNGIKERVRIEKLDAPETWRPDCQQELLQGWESTRYARQLLERPEADISVNPTGRDRYGRTVASITVDGKDYAALMVQSGRGAWWTGKKQNWCE
jgi:endonuclease YncB( thermonuclease family)